MQFPSEVGDDNVMFWKCCEDSCGQGRRWFKSLEAVQSHWWTCHGTKGVSNTPAERVDSSDSAGSADIRVPLRKLDTLDTHSNLPLHKAMQNVYADGFAHAQSEYMVILHQQLQEAEKRGQQKGFAEGYDQCREDNLKKGESGGYKKGELDVFKKGESAGYKQGELDGFKKGESDGFKKGESAGYKKGESDGYKRGETDGFKRGESAGYKQGESDGFKKGESDGYKKGESDGYKKGESDGFKKGESTGFKKGESDGYKQGESDGYRKGRDKPRLRSRSRERRR